MFHGRPAPHFYVERPLLSQNQALDASHQSSASGRFAPIICVQRPWEREAEVSLVPFPDDLRIPEDVKSRGYEYFLEVSTAREILEGFLERQPTLEPRPYCPAARSPLRHNTTCA